MEINDFKLDQLEEVQLITIVGGHEFAHNLSLSHAGAQ